MSPSFGKLLVEASQNRPGRVVLYVDEVRPGNLNRPDKGRCYQAIYWTLAELPDWLRSRASLGWFTFGYVVSSDMKKADVSLSELMAAVLRVFFSPVGGEWNMETIGLYVEADGIRLHMTAGFGFFISDDKAHVEVTGTKGPMGIKPCICCQNVVSRMDEAMMRSIVVV